MVSGVSQIKSSVQRNIRAKLLENYPIEEYIDDIIPKKEGIKIVKCHEHIEIIANTAGDLLFFHDKSDIYIPTLKLLHKYPFMLPHQTVDKGAIRFILSGAHIMCPGLNSSGAILNKAHEGMIVAIMGEGKEHAVAIGWMKLSSDKIKELNKGIGIENVHYLNDGLWKMKPVR
ncbi:unnamed protein product [Gordionus sp. m RMFG-2023]